MREDAPARARANLPATPRDARAEAAARVSLTCLAARDARLDDVGMSTSHPGEAHDSGHAAKLNWLRAGVLGANDGIVSVAGLVMGVAGATTDRTPIVIAGVAGIVSGALSMAVGEYVSVSTQLDSEKALLAKEKWELAHLPEQELAELADLYEDKGLEPALARQVAEQLTARDALRAHAEVELGLDPDDLTNPWAAAGASFVSFALGALVPLLAILLPSPSLRVPVTVVAVVVALALTGWVSARVGGAQRGRAVARNVTGGSIAMGITFAVGSLVGSGVG